MLCFQLAILVYFLCYSPLFTVAFEDCNGDSMNEELHNQCGRVIKDECQAKECLNWTNNKTVPIPVVLETTITNDNFICANQVPLYAFYCTIHGEDLVWSINNDIITAFLPFDTVGRNVSITYPRNLNPIYNITATLTHVSKLDELIPMCVSILTITPFNESQAIMPEVIPFSVSCQSNCRDINRTQVCQTNHYKISATPSKPKQVTTNVTSITSFGYRVASVNWPPPKNQNESSIDYYELTLTSGSNSSDSTTVIVAATTSLPYYINISEGNYTVCVIAVDLCGQRSEPLLSILNMSSSNSLASDQSECDIERQKQEDIANALTISFPLVLISVIAALIIVFIVIGVVMKFLRRKYGSDEQKEEDIIIQKSEKQTAM